MSARTNEFVSTVMSILDDYKAMMLDVCCEKCSRNLKTIFSLTPSFPSDPYVVPELIANVSIKEG